MNDGFVDLGFAKLDTDRARRTGFSEVVFCQNKNEDHLVQIFQTLYSKHGEVLGTRASERQAQVICEAFPNAKYHKVPRLITLQDTAPNPIGHIAVVSAGTADAFVSEEAAICAEFWGGHVERFYDCGVTGLHRILSHVEALQKANVVIAVAGMEGALVSVLGGLVAVPIIAVPTSVGYGANLGGITTLLAMLNSCGNGISVVNIDNGFGAAYSATQINRLASR